MAGTAASPLTAEAHASEASSPTPNASSSMISTQGQQDASSTVANMTDTAVQADNISSQSSSHDSQPENEASAKARKPTVYHGIMEGYSVQFSDGAPDQEDWAKTKEYGQYTPRTLEELQQMSLNLLLPLDAAENDEPKSKYPVMQLPVEIRLRIWEFAIIGDTVDLIDFCHDAECDFEEKTDHPWFKARCFFAHFGPAIKGLSEDYHKPLVTPGLNLLLVSKTIHNEVLPLLPKGRHFNIQAATLECASKIVLACPYVKTVAFPIPAFSNVLNRLSFAGKRGVQWWARHMARYLSEFPDNSVSKVVFWMDDENRTTASRHDEGMIYHRMELNDPEQGKERWNIRFTGSL